METLRISKYLPAFYSGTKEYTNDEWTSVSDVGQSFKGGHFSLENYLEVEEKYVKVAVEFVKRSELRNGFMLKKIEKYSLGKAPIYSKREKEIFESLKDGISVEFSMDDFPDIIRLLLREDVWGEIHFKNSHAMIYVGYDYYLYIQAGNFPSPFLKSISLCGLYYHRIED